MNRASHEAARAELNRYKNLTPTHRLISSDPRIVSQPVYGVLLESLGSGSSSSPSTAQFELYFNGKTGIVQVATNRSVASYGSGDFLTFLSVNGEWVPIGGGGTPLREGYLAEDLEPSGNCGTDPSTANCVEYAANGGTWAATGQTFVVTNRFENTFISAGSHVLCGLYGDEWRVVEFDFTDCRGIFPQVDCKCDPGSGDQFVPCQFTLNTTFDYGSLFGSDPLLLCRTFAEGGGQTCVWRSKRIGPLAVTFPGYGSDTFEAYIYYTLNYGVLGPTDLGLYLSTVWYDTNTSTEYTTSLKIWQGTGFSGPTAPAVGTQYTLNAATGDSNFEWSPVTCAQGLLQRNVSYDITSLEGTNCSGTYQMSWNGAQWNIDSNACIGTNCCPVPAPVRNGTGLGETVSNLPCQPSQANMPVSMEVEVTCTNSTICSDCPHDVGDIIWTP